MYGNRPWQIILSNALFLRQLNFKLLLNNGIDMFWWFIYQPQCTALSVSSFTTKSSNYKLSFTHCPRTTSNELGSLYQADEVLWAQRARSNWLQLGDKNTKYFQTQALIRSKIKQIIKVKDDLGIWHDNHNDIASLFVSSFKKQLEEKM